ncbi:MAG: hypothetical protein R2939_05055 [Kofleriaceae bacterium]
MPAPRLLSATTLLALAAAVGVVTPAAAAPAKPKPKKKKKADTVDISAYRDKLLALTDDDGHYYVVRSEPLGERVVFIGDGKDMYQQRLRGGGSGGGDWSISLRAPRSGINFGEATLWFGKGRYRLDCGERGQSEGDSEVPELRPLAAEETERLLSTATFRPPFWNRHARALARDDAGTSYYVDQLDDQHGGEGFRVFIGRRGAMKEMPMKSVVVDSAGDIFSTKRGELRIVVNTNQTATWIKGRTRTELTRCCSSRTST